MRIVFTKFFYCCLLLLTSFIAGAQTKFYATVTPDHAARDEYVTLSFIIDNGSGNGAVRPPSLNDFEIVSGPNQSSEMSYVNNSSMHQSLTVSYIVRPRKTGPISIGAASVFIGGKTYYSNPLTLYVSNKKMSAAAQQNQLQNFIQMPSIGMDPFATPQDDRQYDDYILHKGENIQDKVNKNMQLRLETDKTSCYTGEPLVANYKLYTRLRSESNLSKNPSFNGFSVVDMTQQADPAAGHEKLNGRDYNVYTIRKAQLYPLQAGNFELETASLDNRITFLKVDNNNLQGTGVTENVTLSSKPVTITVKPLPEEGRPAGFKDAVGNFRIEASLAKTNFSTDETGRLIVTISGSGNMHLLTAPEIKWPDGLESFDPKIIDNTTDRTIPISGSKTFEFPFAVSRPGNYSTPEISFSFFDPATASYKTVYATAISFDVVKGTGKKTEHTEKKDDRSFIEKIFGNRMLVILFLAGFIITGIIIWLNREEKKAKTEASKITDEKDEKSNDNSYSFADVNPLARTEECLNRIECVEFYSILSTEFKEFLSKKYNLPAEGLNMKTLAAAMDKAGVNNHSILQTQDLLQKTDRLLYTPFEHDEKLHEMYARAQTIVQMLNMRS